ncbi:MAG: hypothetical protein ACHQ01_07905 [Candidatus Limnocylindrales bacterium]
MNSIHRGGLMVAAIVAVLTVLGAFVVDGYVSAMNAAAQATASEQAVTLSSMAAPTASPTLEPETIYVEPVPTPAVIKVTRTAKPIVRTGPAPTAPVIHIVVPGPTGGDDGGGD